MCDASERAWGCHEVGPAYRTLQEESSLAGTSAEYVRVGDEGTKATFRFCPKCGATVYYTLEGPAEAIAIPVCAFAKPSFPVPSFSVYEERMHSWVSMPSGIERMA